jgi:nitric-oxide synthase
LPLASDELVWAGRVAWRNHSRCIGRLYWRTLQVRDFRSVESAEGVIDGLLEHLSLAFNAGQIRPILTVFAPACAGRRIKIWNRQVCGYAGYRLPGGATLGDPRNISTTEMAMELGWSPPVDRSGFDLLPLIVTGMDGVTSCRPLPVGAVREVRISHPEIEEMEALGLRWYSVPLVSDMVFRVGGTEYPAAPFNGWYMGTEIGARNLADQSRYDLLPKVAQAMHLDTSREDSLWRDRALIELNRAVLHSFKGAGVRIVDHHTASNEFMQFLKLEEMAGRHVSAQWDWIVPPISASATAVFHTPMKERPASPEFIHIDQPS